MEGVVVEVVIVEVAVVEEVELTELPIASGSEIQVKCSSSLHQVVFAEGRCGKRFVFLRPGRKFV